jgi:hypothetical protein
MIITRKAAIGFILLTAIVFFTTQYTYNQFKAVPVMKEQPKPLYPGMMAYDAATYNPPIVNLGKSTPYVATLLMDIFALCCYIVLKRLEPAINSMAERMILDMKTRDKDD